MQLADRQNPKCSSYFLLIFILYIKLLVITDLKNFPVSQNHLMFITVRDPWKSPGLSPLHNLRHINHVTQENIQTTLEDF